MRQSNSPLTTPPLGMGRRALLCALGGFAAGCAARPVAAPAVLRAAPAPPPSGRPLSVVCVGAHPDDPESGCGGTLLRYAEAGHRVSVVYLTRGELGVQGQSPEVTGRAREAEAREACRMLGAKAIFAGQVNGQAEVTNARADAMRKILEAERPDVLFTHWPLDTDGEHQAASLLTLRAYLALPHTYPLYFYEVEAGSQTIGFHPTAYVDISDVREKKILLLHAHKSQSFDNMYERHHEKMEAFRGRELGVFAAEAFVVLGPDTRNGMRPGI